VASGWRALRRRIITPGTSSTLLEVRGFHVKDTAARELLETIGRTFLAGYAIAAEARTPIEAATSLDGIPPAFRGFAYEGATMGFAVLDGLSLGASRRTETFLAGPGDPHLYMGYVGVGWAMARLPRFRWRRLFAADPLLRWLVLDGYGFHQAYFHTDRYVHEQFQADRFTWPAHGHEWYAMRVIDQGIGRAMWFVGGADSDRVATMIDKFHDRRRADLYSGAGLAATYAGGADEAELRHFLQRAGEYRSSVAQGCVFGASARVRANLVTPHTELAARVFCGLTAAEASTVADWARVDLAGSRRQPSYEQWRQRIANQFVSIER
jgi:enediyne biosynthesis protein E3